MKLQNTMIPLSLLSVSLLILLTASPTSFADEGSYWFKRGQPWSGVKIGDTAPRTRDSICRNNRCYIINDIHWPINQTMRLYGASRFTYKALMPVAIKQIDDNQLLLPDDLGKLIFQRAAKEAFLKRHDKNEKWPYLRPFH